MAFFFMYEPLFGVNIAKGSAPDDLIKIVGENITWINSTTIEVKIRHEANWTDGQPITSGDVEYSYGVYGLAILSIRHGWHRKHSLSKRGYNPSR